MAVASDSKTEPGENLLLQVDDLRKYFPITKGVILRTRIGEVKAVDGVSFTIRDRETLALVGESGCGKTTTGRCVIRAIEPTSGSVQFAAQEGQWVDVLAQKGEDLRRLRRQIQMIFQDPYSSLNPRKRVGAIIGDPFEIHGLADGKELKKQVQERMEVVGLNPEHYNRFPAEFSGGSGARSR